MSSITLSEIVVVTIGAYVIASVVEAIRGLYFHPLSVFPGPPLAVITPWWQFYYDVLLGGKMLAKLGPLHEKYGPIVRVGRNQLHFSDPRAYHDIYFPGSTFNKGYNLYRCFQSNESAFGSVDYREAKSRRDTLAPFFSRRAVIKLEDIIQDKIDRLISQLLTYKQEPVNMHMAFRSTSLDIIMEYLFAQSFDTLGAKNFAHPTLVNLQTGIRAFWVFKYFPNFASTLMSLPRWLLVWLNPDAQGIVNTLTMCERQSDEILANPDSLHQAAHEIIYHHLVAPDPGKRGRTATRKELVDEAHVLLNAGSDTVGGTCTVGTFYILHNEAIRKRLRAELDDARMSRVSSLTFEVLEKLPYLTAVIKESLRLSCGVVTPLPRIVGPGDSTIGGHRVPAGTVVAMGVTYVHYNEDIYPEPHKFDPERWLQPNSKALEKWLVPFSLGPRQCLGMNLAWSELYLIFGNLVSRLDMTIHDTLPEDLLRYDEYFLPVFGEKQFHVYVEAPSD